MNIINKTIMISGASDGIGKSIAIRLAKQQTKLVLLGRDSSKLDAVADACRNLGATVTTYAFDLTNSIERQDALDKINQAHQIDVLINNAGIWHASTPLAELPQDTIESVITINLTAHILVTKSLVASLQTRESAIINIVSTAGLLGRAGRTAYAASKYGMRGFTEALRDELKDSSVRVGAVFQSGTHTNMFDKAGESMDLDKYTNPDDLADVVAFMLTRPPKIWINELHVAY